MGSLIELINSLIQSNGFIPCNDGWDLAKFFKPCTNNLTKLAPECLLEQLSVLQMHKHIVYNETGIEVLI